MICNTQLINRRNGFTTCSKKKGFNAFIKSRFSDCPVVWMFHCRTLNNRINHLHERSLRLVYEDFTSSFEELLILDGSVTIHHRNIQKMAIEMYKVYCGISSGIMNLVFPLNKGKQYPRSNAFSSRNVSKVGCGTETISHLGPKIWSMVPDDFKLFSLSKFKSKIQSWKPDACPCRLCKIYIKNIGFVKI